MAPWLPLGSCSVILKWFQKLFRPGAGSLSWVLDSILPQVWAKHQSGFHWTQVGGGWQLFPTFSFQGSAQGSQIQKPCPAPLSVLVAMHSCWRHSPLHGGSRPWIWAASTLCSHGEVYRRRPIIVDFDSHLHRTVISWWHTYSTQIQGGPPQTWFIYKKLCILTFNLQSSSRYCPFDAIHQSTCFLLLKSFWTHRLPCSASALSRFPSCISAKYFPLRIFFLIKGKNNNNKKSLGARSGD